MQNLCVLIILYYQIVKILKVENILIIWHSRYNYQEIVVIISYNLIGISQDKDIF